MDDLDELIFAELNFRWVSEGYYLLQLAKDHWSVTWGRYWSNIIRKKEKSFFNLFSRDILAFCRSINLHTEYTIQILYLRIWYIKLYLYFSIWCTNFRFFLFTSKYRECRFHGYIISIQSILRLCQQKRLSFGKCPRTFLLCAFHSWASYQICKIARCACTGNAGKVLFTTNFKGMC